MKRAHEIGVRAMLANGYHNFHQSLQIKMAGGLAKFSGWNGPTFTDSGGFQIQSLGHSAGKVISTGQEIQQNSRKSDEKSGVEISRRGVAFRDPFDGKIREFTPETALANEVKIGADVHMNFDYLTNARYDPRDFSETELQNFADDHAYQNYGVELTDEWQRRGLREKIRLVNQSPDSKFMATYNSTQGAGYEDLRRKSARLAAEMEVDGIRADGVAIGGVIDKIHAGLAETIRWEKDEIPENLPVHLLGLSRPEDIFAAVEGGVDTFDCVEPSKVARHGRLFTTRGDIADITRGKFADDFAPIDCDCDCPICAQNFSKVFAEIPEKIVGYYNSFYAKPSAEKLQKNVENLREKLTENAREISEKKSEKLRAKNAKMDNESRAKIREKLDDLEREKIAAQNEIANLEIVISSLLNGGEKPISRRALRAMARAENREVRALFFHLATAHNIRFTVRIAEAARAAILRGNYAEFRDDFLRKYRGEND